jgi:K+-sensing histidine kinase KdpD
LRRLSSRLPATLARTLLSPTALRLTAPWRLAVAPAATLLAFLVQLEVSPRPSVAPFVFFFAAVAVSSWLGGRGPGLLSVALSAALANYAFMAPGWSWSTSGPALTATALFFVAGPSSRLCSRSGSRSSGRADARPSTRASSKPSFGLPSCRWCSTWSRRFGSRGNADRIDANRFGVELLE